MYWMFMLIGMCCVLCTHEVEASEKLAKFKQGDRVSFVIPNSVIGNYDVSSGINLSNQGTVSGTYETVNGKVMIKNNAVDIQENVVEITSYLLNVLSDDEIQKLDSLGASLPSPEVDKYVLDYLRKKGLHDSAHVYMIKPDEDDLEYALHASQLTKIQ